MDENQTVIQDTNGSEADTQTQASGNTGYSERERQSYERMKKERERADALERELNTLKSQTPLSDMEWKERMEIKVSHGIKDDKTLDFVMKNGGLKALEDDLVKAAIQRRQEDNEAQAAVAFNTSAKSPIEKRYSQEEIQSMSADDLAAAIRGKKI